MRRLALVAFVAGVIGFTPPAAHAAYPGGNGKIVFWTNRDDPSSAEIYSMNSDGTGVTRLTNNPTGGVDPVWSPDGERIAFVRGSFPSADVFVMNSDGSGQTPITSGPAGDHAPTWSPDGTKIAFQRSEGGTSSIYVANADGSGTPSNLTPDAMREFEPAWSPDGTKIAFSRYPVCCVSQIWVMNPDGSGQVNISNNSESDRLPDWSPDGKTILFARVDFQDPDTGGYYYDLFTMSAGGASQSFLSAGTEASWSPDGLKIVRSNLAAQQACDCTPDVPIFVMNANGTGATPIATTSVNAEPDWQPLGALDPYPRPGGATPLRVPLVPAYAQCTDPAFQHVGPLDEPSCGPPIQESSLLTTSTTGKGLGSARLDVQVGDPLTAEDEADVAIKVSATDVRNASGPIDYSGQVIFTTALQMTDRANGFGEVSGTTGLFGFSAPVDCTPSPDPSAGSSCTLNTTADSLVAGTAKEGKRAVVATRLIRILDLGADGQLNPNCPPTCGTGDEKAFLGAGVFTP